MRILLDECVPLKLRGRLVGHQVYTVRMMSWTGWKNGDLIRIADQQFDAFVTIDRNLAYQQNLTRVRMAIIVLQVDNNKIDTVLAGTDRLLASLATIRAGEYRAI